MRLVFDPTKVPRSTTREMWREMDRWRRLTERTLRENMERKLAVLGRDEFSAFGQTVLDEIINPPLMMGPYQ